MMYGPGYNEPVPPMVSPWTMGWGYVSEGSFGTAPASASYEVANKGVWVPVLVPVPVVARRMWWANGATVNASYNVEVGIYSDYPGKPDRKIITTGSVAQGTANNVQFADITDTALAPGMYWFYISCSSTAATFFRSVTASAAWDELLRLEQTSIGPGSAPTTATPVESTQQGTYVFGFATTASP